MLSFGSYCICVFEVDALHGLLRVCWLHSMYYETYFPPIAQKLAYVPLIFPQEGGLGEALWLLFCLLSQFTYAFFCA